MPDKLSYFSVPTQVGSVAVMLKEFGITETPKNQDMSQ
jgi:hypothetical protein